MIIAAYKADTGEITGFYREDIHPEIPEPNIEISEEKWRDHLVGSKIYRAVAGEVIEHVPPPSPTYPDQVTARAAMVRWIDKFLLAITGAVPEHERASWPSKAEAARAVVAGTARTDQTAMITAEADVLGQTDADVASRIIANADQYETIVAQSAGLRQQLDAEIEAASDPMEYETILANGQTQAKALAASHGITIE